MPYVAPQLRLAPEHTPPADTPDVTTVTTCILTVHQLRAVVTSCYDIQLSSVDIVSVRLLERSRVLRGYARWPPR